MEKPSNPPLANERVQILRTVQQHHAQLSAMADHKASILIAASFVILAIAFLQFGSENPSAALLVLAAFSVAAAIMAILAILPRTRPQSKRSGKMNLFFFGNFAQLSEREFTEAILELLDRDHEREALEAMIRDIYQLGSLLYLRKYRFLTWSYYIFLAGIISATITFLVSMTGAI